MAYLNTQSILDAVMLELVDNSATMRTKALAWLNQTIRDTLNQPRAWKFLEATVTLDITDNQITLPAGASEIVYLLIGNAMLTPANQLSDVDAQRGEVGYTRSADGAVTIYPGATGECVLKYEAGLNTKYTDSEDATIFPLEFENVFISGTLMRCFKTEKDGRFPAEVELYRYQLELVKAWDNRLKPQPGTNSHGYIRAAAIAGTPGDLPAVAGNVLYSERVVATDGNQYQLEIVDNGDGTFSHTFVRVA